MHLVILCGGSGERMKNYSYPKPLNMIYGKPALSYTLKSIPKSFQTIHFIYAKHLIEYNFEHVVTNLCKDRQCKFYCIDYFTRGPVESALIGIENTILPDEPIMFLDNDNIYTFPENWDNLTIDSAFLGCAKDTSGSEAYSFVKHVGSQITAIREKVRISDTYCLGIYGFQSISQFKKLATEELINNTEKEYYMSSLFQRMLQHNISVKYLEFPNTAFHIGSLDEVERNLSKLSMPKMRICFDLDNTLVTYPKIAGDYTSVEPIPSMIQLIRKLHLEGHTIIIHTARRMETHKYNIGAVMKDIGKITFDTLEKFNIPYDEILFGKPIADIYIDDRAVNPYRHDLKSMGLFQYEENIPILNMCAANKYNSLKLSNKNEVVKSGPKELLKGQAFFYQNLPKVGIVSSLFPRLLGVSETTDTVELRLEYLKGIPMTYLLEHKLFTTAHIDRLLEILDILHTTKITINKPEIDNIKVNYRKKFLTRMENTEVYPFYDREFIRDTMLEKLDLYLNSETISSVDMIHGDFWLSNIILLFDGTIKLIDMRGEVENTLTLGGDPLYDYAKLYQSLIGYDSVLHNTIYTSEYKNCLISYYEGYISKLGLDPKIIKNLSIVLMIGSFHAIEEYTTRLRIWNWIKELI